MKTPLLGNTPITTPRPRSMFIDGTVILLLLAIFLAIIKTGEYWLGKPLPEANISHSVQMLPVYAFYSCVRIGVAYLLSLVFAVAYGYVAAYNKRVEAWMIAVLDILQSIPVLSFLPGVMLAMMALIPGHQLGIELGSIILIFTGQVWNMAFSFYSSLKSIPREMIEATRINRFSAWQRFWQLELPFSAIGLIWNSIMSVAGGWFALIACETFPLGQQSFRLPGLGSYLQAAAFSDPVDVHGLVWGMVALILIIVACDQLIWRPLIASSAKFKIEQVESSRTITSPILTLLQRPSRVLSMPGRSWDALNERVYQRLARSEECRVVHAMDDEGKRKGLLVPSLMGFFVALFIFWGGFHAWEMVRGAAVIDLHHLLLAAGATYLRVNASLVIAALWTIPVGVAIGSNPRLAPVLQPITQLIASVPASAFFPVAMMLMMRWGLGLGIGSVALMLLGTQWYILFNVIAGAMAIPSDLKEAAAVYKFTRWQRWRRLILPGIFPYLITGMVTASGGAWNASILAEYGLLGKRTFQTIGLGSEITAAQTSNNLATLLLATILMAAIVVTTNRLVWRRLYKLAETRYKLEG
ncbi:ABC transporter permease [Telmatobacter bradus]|uniref:ABC transporter permease n=1 Tax=Telmatobacter bradus TaxID=474953 RepID=UPI003B437DAA